MANWNEPTVASLHTAVISELKNRDLDVASMFSTLPTNPVSGMKRWNATNSRFEEYNGSSWVVLDSEYEINVTQLGGQLASYYLDIGNMTAGTLAAARFNDTSHGSRGGGSLHAVATTGAAGFMSATDKTKLDSVESNATADQTPAEILSALLTVDGPGSGLDADSVDGIPGSVLIFKDNTDNGEIQINVIDADFSVGDSSDAVTKYFWRSHSGGLLYIGTAAAVPTLRANLDMNGNNIVNAVAITTTGAISGGSTIQSATAKVGNTNAYFENNNLYFESGDHQINSNDGGGNFNFRIGHYYDSGNKYSDTGKSAVHLEAAHESGNTGFLIHLGETAANAVADAAVVWNYTFELGGDGTFEWGGNTVWHSGNDGPASGLDADTVDGVQAANLMRNGVINTLTYSTTVAAPLTITNAFGHGANVLGAGAVVQKWVGDSDAMLLENLNAGDYILYNNQQGNGIYFADGTGGVQIYYNGASVARWNADGFNVASGGLYIGGNEIIDANGDATANLGNAGLWQEIERHTLAGESSLALNVAGYKRVKIVIHDFVPSNDGTSLCYRFSRNSSIINAAVYASKYIGTVGASYSSWVGTTFGLIGGGDGTHDLGSAANEDGHFELDVYGLDSVYRFPFVKANGVWETDAGLPWYQESISGIYDTAGNGTDVVDEIVLYPATYNGSSASGTLESGTVIVYGMKE